MRVILRISDWLNQVVLKILGVLVIGLFGINIYAVFFRYVLNNPLPWPVPISRILLVWIALVGISVALKEGEHVAIEGAVRALPPKYERVIRLFGCLIIGVWLVVVIWQGWLAAARADQLMMITANLQISFKWRLMAVPVSGIIQLVHILAWPSILDKAMERRETA
ncbi:MAG: TRAP transporter small permease [Deltaproteobacteria bacterium]|nr:TRAP transporter small permease [Deltaproteobacteria bacterium]